jgi:hypothetical protein
VQPAPELAARLRAEVTRQLALFETPVARAAG